MKKKELDFYDIFSRWEKNHSVFDKDAHREKIEQRKKMQNSSFVKKMLPQDTIDLHGMTQDEAWDALNNFVANARQRGLRKILIIHGKGLHSQQNEGILGDLVRNFIEGDLRLGEFGKADKKQGGSGATWVVIR